MPLPVTEILPALRAALAHNAPVALVAPPGAGKTTAIAPALLSEPWAADGKFILLSPRRLAARAAAERMAELAGEPVGQTIGYRTRMDSRTSAATRIEVVTEGIFTRMLVADPELPGVAAVLFDEIHERSLESDLALALTLEAREALCPHLRLLLMSATLDGAAYEAIIPELVRLESHGRMYPVTLRHIGRDAAVRIEDSIAAAIRTALTEETGSLLAFLPGAAEIERTAERLEGRLPADVDLYRLYGARDAVDQRAAIRPAPTGRRKVVLATSIAETSITIDGVRIIIDAGLSRLPKFDRATGLTRLVTQRASQAAVTQRAGRGGRTAPGTAIRLWETGETAGRPRFDPPEILESDLTGLVLECARWGVTAPLTLRWLDPPPKTSLAEARDRLLAIDALTTDGRPTTHGERIAAMPLPPVLGHMLVRAAAQGMANLAARIAVIITERGLGGRSINLDERLSLFARDRSPRGQIASRLAERLAKGAGASLNGTNYPDAAARLLATAFPDRVARRRGPAGSPYLMANGRAVVISDDDPLNASSWIVVADVVGSASGARAVLAAALDPASIEALFKDSIETRSFCAFDPTTRSVSAETIKSLGAIRISRVPMEGLDSGAVAMALLEGVRTHGIDLLPWGDGSKTLRARASFAVANGLVGLPDTADEALLDTIDSWLAPLVVSKRRLTQISDAELTQALANRIGWADSRRLDVFAPPVFETPAGSRHDIDYTADGGPVVDVRVQALFGLSVHPAIADGSYPLTLRLTSPAGRPIQVTKDLPRFWSGSWTEVRRELRGRYPKHSWPEDPANAPPTLRARRPGQA